jgi:hypothetical protein
MKRFLITYTYRLEDGARAAWHATVAAFISALDEDPLLRGRIKYTCLKAKGGDAYTHLAEVADEEAGQALQQREYFKSYTAEAKRVAGGLVDVTPLETIAQTR